MKPFTFFGKTYAFLVSLLFATSASQSQTVLGILDVESVSKVWNLGIRDATRINIDFSYQVDDTSFKRNDARSILSSIYSNTSEIIQSIDKNLFEDSSSDKNATYLIRIRNEHFAHCIGSASLVL